MPASQTDTEQARPTNSSQYSHSYANLPASFKAEQESSPYLNTVGLTRAADGTRPSSIGSAKYAPLGSSGRVAASDANLLLGLNTPYTTPADRMSNSQSTYTHSLTSLSSAQLQPQASPYGYQMAPAANERQAGSNHVNSNSAHLHPSIDGDLGGMLIESQDIDMTTLQQQDHFPFPFSGEILPWLEYLPQDVLNYFGEHQSYPHLMSPGSHPSRPPQ